MKALFGGSFDPIHLGHLNIARQLLIQFSFSELYFVPAFQNPLKGATNANADQRRQMVELAIAEANEPRFHVLDWELKREFRSYTVDTLDLFVKMNGDTALLIGDEVFREFLSWKEPQKILQLAHVIVFSRLNQTDPRGEVLSALGAPSPLQKPVAWVPLEVLPVSSTEIRRQLFEKTEPQGLSPLVRRFIKDHALYTE